MFALMMRTFQRAMAIAESSVKAGKIKEHDTPANWIDWAESKGYSVVHLMPASDHPFIKFDSTRGYFPPMLPIKNTDTRAANVNDVPVITPNDDNVEEQAANNHDEILAGLFDPLPVEALAKTFLTDKEQTSAQWEKWAEHASRNGLKAARQGRKKFNPYLAGMWFVRNGREGWDDARLHRELVKVLPHRSKDSKHILTGDIADY